MIKRYIDGDFNLMIQEIVKKLEHLYLNKNILKQMQKKLSDAFY